MNVANFLSAPYMLPRYIQMGSSQVLKNLQKNAKLRFDKLAFANKGKFRDKALESIIKKGKAPLGLRFEAGAERFLQGFIDTSRKNPFLYASGELFSAAGSGTGATISEELYPGEALPRVGFELGLGVPSALVPHLALSNVIKKSYGALKDFRTKAKEINPVTGEKFGAKGAAKASSFIGASVTGLSICAPSGPWALVCGVVTGTASWVGVDAAMTEVDQAFNEDDFQKSVEMMIDAQKNTLKKLMKDSYKEWIETIFRELKKDADSLKSPYEQLSS